jgi:hypothetical protein
MRALGFFMHVLDLIILYHEKNKLVCFITIFSRLLHVDNAYVSI